MYRHNINRSYDDDRTKIHSRQVSRAGNQSRQQLQQLYRNQRPAQYQSFSLNKRKMLEKILSTFAFYAFALIHARIRINLIRNRFQSQNEVKRNSRKKKKKKHYNH